MLRSRIYSLLLVFHICLIVPLSGEGIDNITYLQAQTENGKNSYDYKVLALALDKTLAEYGEYEITLTPKMSIPRIIWSLTNNVYPNVVRTTTLQYANFFPSSYSLIEFPVRLGAMGYRVCAFSSDLADEVAKIKTLEDFAKYRHVQGVDWADTIIFRYNDVNVYTLGKGDMDVKRSIIRMYKEVDEKRADAFCRSAHEISLEKDLYDDLENVSVDKTLALFYHHPLLFFANSNNTRLRERITKGLNTAYHDGSLSALWEKDFGAYSAQVLKGRNILHLDSPWKLKKETGFDEFIFTPNNTKRLNKMIKISESRVNE